MPGGFPRTMALETCRTTQVLAGLSGGDLDCSTLRIQRRIRTNTDWRAALARTKSPRAADALCARRYSVDSPPQAPATPYQARHCWDSAAALSRAKERVRMREMVGTCVARPAKGSGSSPLCCRPRPSSVESGRGICHLRSVREGLLHRCHTIAMPRSASRGKCTPEQMEGVNKE